MTQAASISYIRRNGTGQTRRQGFTLFEVSISLVLVAFGVISVLMLFPSGLKAQQMARFQIYAAAKAEEMLEQFNGTQHSNPAIDTEGLAMWDVPVAHKAQSWDLESRLSAHRFGIMPLPLDIARRLDSDGDEIQQILDEGGFVYFSQPLASTGTQEQGAADAPPNEAQKMIIGVKGYAQQNCLSSFPLKNWPYHTPWPSPPLQMHHMADKFLPKTVNWVEDPGQYRTNYYQYYSWPWMDNEDQVYNNRMNVRNHSETYCVPWETSPSFPGFVADPDIQKVFDWPVDDDNPVTPEYPLGSKNMVAPNYPVGSNPQEQPLHVGYFPYACGRLWEAGGVNPPWVEWDVPPNAGPPAIVGTRHPYTIGALVNAGGNTYSCIAAHLAQGGAGGNGPPPNAAFWVLTPSIAGAFPATHLEQITRSKSTTAKDSMPSETLRSGQAVYGEFPSRPSVGRYVATTLWYANRKGFPWTSINTVKDPYLNFTSGDSREQWKEVQAFRFLAHATTCLTAWYSYDSMETDNLKNGVAIPRIKLLGDLTPDGVKITHNLVKYYHERSLHLINLFAASYPNDWAMPRPLNRAIMMDFPLLQSDMFVPPLPGPRPGGLPANPLYDSTTQSPPAKDVENPTYPWTKSIPNENYTNIFGRTQASNPQQWRVVSSEPIRNIGVSSTFPTNLIDSRMQTGSHSSHFGHPEHFNLTAKFDAAERCRELIFWVVDWQAYEDFETARSAPVDASKYPLGAPRSEWHESGHIIPTNRTRNFNQRMGDLEFRDEQLWSYRNPEKTLLFFKLADPDGAYKKNPDLANGIAGNIGVDVRTLPTGFNVEANMVLNRPWNNYPDKGSNKENRENFVGLWGADRNFNKKLDRGPLPKSVRLRAVQVARFNFYDPRVQAILR